MNANSGNLEKTIIAQAVITLGFW